MHPVFADQPALHAEPPGRRWDGHWGSVASFVAHALLIALIPLLAVSRPVVPPPPRPIAVELISAAPPLEVPAAPPEAPPVLAAPEADAEPAEAAPPPESGPVKATQFFASKVLAEDPHLAKALPTLGNDERVVQLCNIEALEQIKLAKPEFAPDTLVAYAFDEMNIAGGVLNAPGGAFRSRRRWWAVNLTCAVAPDYSAVTAFEFTLGDEIPKDQWEEHYLTEEEQEE